MSSSRLSYLALKKEAITSVAEKPTHFLKFKDGDIEVNKTIIENNPIMNNRANAICPVEGQITTEGTYNFDLDAIESLYLLYGALGNIVTTDVGSTASQVYKHVLSVANSLPSFTLEQGKGNLSDTTNNLQNYQVDRSFGTMVDTLTLSGSDGIINMEVAMKAHGVFQRSLLIGDVTSGSNVDISLETVEGLTISDTVNIFDNTPKNETDAITTITTSAKTIQIATLGASYLVTNKAKVELVPQIPSYGVCKPFSFVNCNFQFGSNLITAALTTEENIENWDFSYENQLEERFGSLRASPSVIAPKGYIAKLTFTKYFENIEERDKYLAMEKQACILTISNNEVIGINDTNNFKYTIKLEISDLRITSALMPTGTDDLYAVNVEGTCFYDNTDGRTLQMTILNNQAGTVYTA